MPVTKFLPVPLVVAALAFVWMYLAAQFNLLGWVAFITWGAYFLSGVSTKSAVREAIAFTAGLVFAWVIVLLGTALVAVVGLTFAFPLAVFMAAFVIVLLELVPWFDMAPAYFLGAAAFFAAGGGTNPDNLAVLISVWIPGILGLVFGVLSAYLRGSILKAEGVKDPLTTKA